MKIALVTDSTSDLSPELQAKHAIHVVGNFIVIDGKSYEDNIDISREDFYARLPGMTTVPTTATASAGTYQDLYESLLNQGYEAILSIHPPLILSGIINAASTAAEAIGPQVHVVDSGQVSYGTALQILDIAERVRQGWAVDTILQHLASMRSRMRIVALLDTLEYIRRSGRVSWAKARLGSLFKIKPFIELKEGKVLSLGQERTSGRAFERLVEHLNQLHPLEMLAVLHSNAEAEARRFMEAAGVTSEYVVNVTTIIGTHVGPNAIGFAALPAER